MAFLFFAIKPIELVSILKYAGWGIGDLRGRGRMREVIVWLSAIADLASQETKALKKALK
jgi:hypothetical protein